MLKACLKRPLYNLLEFKPKNLKNEKYKYLGFIGYIRIS
jgi:hypothetical protein